MRLRKAEFAGREDKFYAPADDLRNCMVPIIRAGLVLGSACTADQEGARECAKALAAYCEGALLAKEKVPDLLGKLLADMNAAGEGSALACLAGIACSALCWYGSASRETSAHADLGASGIREIAEAGVLLAKLPENRRKQLTTWLQEAGAWPAQLDWPPPAGMIRELVDSRGPK